MKNNNNENEKYNLETKKGILPNMMLLRQICDFPDLNNENENFDIEDRKDENRKVDIINYNANDVNEYGCATVKRQNNNDDNHNDNNNESNKDTNNFNINYQAERLQKENENFVSTLIKNSNKLKVTLFYLFCLFYFNSYFDFYFYLCYCLLNRSRNDILTS